MERMAWTRREFARHGFVEIVDAERGRHYWCLWAATVERWGLMPALGYRPMVDPRTGLRFWLLLPLAERGLSEAEARRRAALAIERAGAAFDWRIIWAHLGSGGEWLNLAA